MQKTLILVKPDGVKKRLSGEILARFERRGLQIIALKMIKMSVQQAKYHYAEHEGKPFFNELVDFITSAPIVAAVISGENAIKAVRTMMGTTDPLNSAPGTIRGDYALNLANNIIHGSDSEVSAAREIANFFEQSEMFD